MIGIGAQMKPGKYRNESYSRIAKLEKLWEQVLVVYQPSLLLPESGIESFSPNKISIKEVFVIGCVC